jgi:CRISPR/Cas system-associated exonuclease Cas4 (RecB family)
MLVEKFTYPTLKRVTAKNGQRQYTGDDDQPVPSVTTVLSDTGDKTALINWRKRVGDAEANRISQEAAGLGTKVHNALEKYVLNEDYDISGNNHISVMAKAMLDEMIDKGLSQVNEIWGVEVALIAKGLYAGTSDAVGMFNGVESIIDFKTAKKIKKREWIEDYFMQGCAYALAHNEMFGTDIKQVAILMIDREGKYADFVINGDEFEEYCNKWAMRLADYYNKV